MEESLKILDTYDRNSNIYEVIKKFADRGHQILNGAASTVKDETANAAMLVMMEVVEDGGEKKGKEE